MEAIAAITIIATIMAVISRVILVAVESYSAAATRAELHAALSGALERVCAELRFIDLKSGGSSAPDIESVSATSITWATNSALELTGSDLTLSVAGGPARTVLSDVTGFELQCFDESNTALTATLSGIACQAVQRIRIHLTVQRGGITESLRTRVFLRSRTTGSST